MYQERITIDNGGTLVTELTSELVAFCAEREDGLVNVFVPHATAGLALMETGSGSEEDLAATIDAILPISRPYAHRHGSSGHGRDHVVPVLISPSVTIPVLHGSPQLGTWQRLVLVDTNRDNTRRGVVFSHLTG